jgi:N-carbamoylputrescine amidase
MAALDRHPRVGVEGELEFWGNSFIVDPFGEVIARASATDPEILMAECNLAKIEEVRRNWPFLRDRRIDAYSGITRRFLDEDPSGNKSG